MSKKTETQKTWAEAMEILCAPIPPDMLRRIAGKAGGKLSDINSGYLFARLNETFGAGRWRLDIADRIVKPLDQVNKDGVVYGVNYSVVLEGKLIATVGDEVVETGQCFGGHSSSDAGDAYKGATTSLLKQCAKFWGFGLDVYMGLHDIKTQPAQRHFQRPQMPVNSEAEAIAEMVAVTSREQSTKVWNANKAFQKSPAFIEAAKKMAEKFPQQPTKTA